MNRFLLQAKDVCWHVQSAFEVAPWTSLSFTSTLSTPECILSLQLQHLAILLEMVLLGALQETHADPAGELTQHRDVLAQAGSAPVGRSQALCEVRQRHLHQQPHPQDGPAAVPADLLEGMYVSCGARQRLDVHSAVQHMFGTILRHHRARTPLHVWSATCKEFVCMLQDCWGGERDDAGCAQGLFSSGGIELHAKQTPLQNLSVIPTWLVARALWEELQTPEPVVCPHHLVHCAPLSLIHI